jgi:catechol 2,3-dioxygenase-like lactoylglutathione lyase family enzyme
MKVKEIAFTCYPVSDMPRARAFYEGILGLKPGMTSASEGGQWVEYEIGPHVLSLGCAPGFEANKHGGTAALEVEDFDKAI